MLTRAGEVLYTAMPEGPVTGGWGQWYESRAVGSPYQHRGLDIGNYGNPYRAGTWGQVVPFTNNGNFGGYGAYGLGVCVDHGQGRFRYTLFAHNSRLLVNVGDIVGPDTLIAVSGATGDVQGGHIHIQRQVDTRFSIDLADSADPLQFLATEEEQMESYRWALVRVSGGAFRPMLDAYAKLHGAGYFADLEAIEGPAAPIDGNNDLNDAIVRRERLRWLAGGPRALEAAQLLGVE